MAREPYTWESLRKSGPSYRSDDGMDLRWWALLAIVLSFALHGGLIYVFNVKQIHIPLGPGPEEVVRKERFTISEDLLRQQAAVVEMPDVSDVGRPDVEAFTPDLDRYDVQDLVPEDEALRFTPSVSEPANLVREPGPESPADQNFSSSLEELSTAVGSEAIGESLRQMQSEVLLRPAVSDQQLQIDSDLLDSSDLASNLLEQASEAGGGGDGEATEGFSSLDQLLGQGGQIADGTDPILMPTDLLFGYDSDQLLGGARLSMMKLGMLIMRNPEATFVIEGHTDTFGTQSYNQELSRRRAEAVKSWLVSSLRIDPARVRTVGQGMSNPLANPDGSVEQQQLNRRVEIEVLPP